MRKGARMKLIKTILIFIVAFGVPYLINIEFNFFNANFVTIESILGLWIGFPISTIVFSYALSIIIDNEKFERNKGR